MSKSDKAAAILSGDWSGLESEEGGSPTIAVRFEMKACTQVTIRRTDNGYIVSGAPLFDEDGDPVHPHDQRQARIEVCFAMQADLIEWLCNWAEVCDTPMLARAKAKSAKKTGGGVRF